MYSFGVQIESVEDWLSLMYVSATTDEAVTDSRGLRDGRDRVKLLTALSLRIDNPGP